MGERSSARGNTLRTALLASGAILGAAALTACGGNSEAPVATTSIAPSNNPDSNPNLADPCTWSPAHHRPVDTENPKMITVDSRCTKPADLGTFLYKLPKNGHPTQARSEAVEDINGIPVSVPSPTRLLGKCVVKGDHIRNDLAVGSDWWIAIDEHPVLGAANLEEGQLAVVPEVHAGFPLHDVQRGVSVGPNAFPVC